MTDYFYAYGTMPYDDGWAVKGHFGYKALAVSYGGTLQLFGNKGAAYDETDPSDSGISWVRLAATLEPGQNTVVLDRPVGWMAGDQIVVTTRVLRDETGQGQGQGEGQAGEPGQGVDLTGTEAVPLVSGMPAGVHVGERGEPERRHRLGRGSPGGGAGDGRRGARIRGRSGG